MAVDDGPVAEAKKPRPRPKKEQVKPTCTPANARFWKSLDRYRGKCRTDGKRVYYWDRLHGDLEVFNRKTRKHEGSVHPDTGKYLKDPVKGRKLDEDRDC
ncbi:hypothetical protein C3Y87_18170 [Carbonactinospora thermoautotrophica]|uniref:colicin E3/pyocin S6 family cytotoxin n=1 Tax=Carbonactinospora thermoautotrophica TaxID=1469144 RepID=UPI00226E2B7A|nr:colicin E3/pyocin S6 family cytotoxin [Carbonactinospora thermoautotrophica]MCX9193293.1 hypothetical protein [Carbonactinospora thermoautotrophica]